MVNYLKCQQIEIGNPGIIPQYSPFILRRKPRGCSLPTPTVALDCCPLLLYVGIPGDSVPNRDREPAPRILDLDLRISASSTTKFYVIAVVSVAWRTGSRTHCVLDSTTDQYGPRENMHSTINYSV